MAKTKIEWCDCTWNPIVGCSPVSAGCDHCYACRMATRLAANPKTSAKYGGLASGGQWTGEVRLMDNMLRLPRAWKKSRIVFVNSMGDFFHPNAKTSDQVCVCISMRDFGRHKFVILTKRAAEMEHFSRVLPMFGKLDCIWAGVSVENQIAADARIHLLKQTNVKHRILSCEPLLGPVKIDLDGIDWVIAGGETGPGARPMHTEWVRSIRDQCVRAGTPLFFKGWGECVPVSQLREEHTNHFRAVQLVSGLGAAQDETGYAIKKKYSGAVIDGREWHQFPPEMNKLVLA